MITVIGGTKGGSGKSTTAVHLAVMRAMAGHRVCLIDVDRQRSAYGWGQIRVANSINPVVDVDSRYIESKVARDSKLLVEAGKALTETIKSKLGDYDDVIVDVGGTDNPALRFAMLAADQWFVPLSPSAFDTWALADLSEVYDIVGGTGRNPDLQLTIFGANISPLTIEHKEISRVREAFPEFRYLDVIIHQRAPLRRALSSGQTVFDMPRIDPKIRTEFMRLYEAVFSEQWNRTREVA